MNAYKIMKEYSTGKKGNQTQGILGQFKMYLTLTLYFGVFIGISVKKKRGGGLQHKLEKIYIYYVKILDRTTIPMYI